MADTSSNSFANTTGSNIIADALILDASYKGNEVTQKVSSILGIPAGGWSVVDTADEGNLALVHYDDVDGPAVSALWKLRGVLVDTEVGAVVADSFGYTAVATCDALAPDNDGMLRIVADSGETHTFPMDNVVIKRGFEGVVLRAIWRKGAMRLITHRKIDPSRSRWGSSKSFVAMYHEAGGPKAEELFDTSKPYSDTCYTFLVVHPDLLVGSRQQVLAPYIVFIAQRSTDVRRPADEVAPGVATFAKSAVIGGKVTTSFVHNPGCLTLASANEHLKNGYYSTSACASDKRQGTGESVIVYSMHDGVITDVVKVHSHSYSWRLTMRGNSPNIAHRFYSLLGIAYPDVKNDDAWNKLCSKLIPVPLYDEESVKELFSRSGGLLIFPEGEVERSDYYSRDARIQLLWMNYVLSLPTTQQAANANLFSIFKKDRTDVISWIQGIESRNPEVDNIEVIDRVKALINTSRRFARESLKKGSNYSARGDRMSLPVLIKNSLKNFLQKEDGVSLYAIVRAMKQERQLAAAPASNPTPVTPPAEE